MIILDFVIKGKVLKGILVEDPFKITNCDLKEWYIGYGITLKQSIMDNNAQLIVPEEIIMDRIYLIRGMKVMLDFDLSELYRVEHKLIE